jgi:hypothetical protein
MGYGRTAYNRIVCAAPAVAGLAYEKPQSGLAPLCAVFLRHIWGGGLGCALPYYPPQTSHTAGTLYAMRPKIGSKYME